MNKRIIGAAITAAVVIAAAGTAVAATGTGGTASDYTPAAPVRLADTVPAHQVGPVKGPIGAGKTLTVALTGVPANATAVVVNVTATGPTVSGFLTAYGDGASRPATSTVNFAAGQTIANQATLPVSNGKIDVFNSAGSTNIVVDLEGYYTPAAPAYVPPSITKWTSPVTGTINTGGSAVTRATQLGTVSLSAGTYQISLDAKATPIVQANAATQVQPKFFIYTQPISSTFAGDALNVGAGYLESGAFTNIDSDYSGTGTITLTANTTIYVYAFGYDSDTGAGTYTLDGAQLTAVPVAD